MIARELPNRAYSANSTKRFGNKLLQEDDQRGYVTADRSDVLPFSLDVLQLMMLRNGLRLVNT